MALSVGGVQLRVGRSAGSAATATLSDVSASHARLGWLLALLRAPLLVERIWIRRARCVARRRSHAPLPDLVLFRRLDVAAVIGTAVLLTVIDRLGLRSIADPPSWLDVALQGGKRRHGNDGGVVHERHVNDMYSDPVYVMSYAHYVRCSSDRESARDN